MILREPTISLLQDAGLDEVLESSSDPYIDDLLKSLSVSERVPDDSSFFLLAGWGSRGSRAGSAEGDAASRADECRRRAGILVQNFDTFEHCLSGCIRDAVIYVLAEFVR